MQNIRESYFDDSQYYIENEEDYDDFCEDRFENCCEENEVENFTTYNVDIQKEQFKKEEYKKQKNKPEKKAPQLNQNPKYLERQANKKRLEGIKRVSGKFKMKIVKAEFKEKKEKRGMVLSGWVYKGGIYQDEKASVLIGEKRYKIYTVTCYMNHKRYSYAPKGRFVSLFVKDISEKDFEIGDMVNDLKYE